MIRIETVSGMDSRDWEHLVETCGGHPLHLPEIHAADQGSEPLLLAFKNETQTIGCALAYRSGGGRFHRTPRRLHLPASPAVVASADRAESYARLLDLARELHCRELIIQPQWGTRYEDMPAFSSHVSEVLVEFVLDLDRAPEAIEAGMHRVHRKNVRRATRDGVTVAPDSSLEGLLTLRSMQQSSSERSAQKGGGFTVRDRSFFERLHKTVYAPGRGELLFAYRDGKTLAGLAYVTGAGRSITVRSGSTPEGYALQAMYVLQSSVIDRARERGLRALNLGGVPEAAATPDHPQRGLYEFKRGWGGHETHSEGIHMTVSA